MLNQKCLEVLSDSCGLDVFVQFWDVLHCRIPHIEITSKDNKYNKIQHA